MYLMFMFCKKKVISTATICIRSKPKIKWIDNCYYQLILRLIFLKMNLPRQRINRCLYYEWFNIQRRVYNTNKITINVIQNTYTLFQNHSQWKIFTRLELFWNRTDLIFFMKTINTVDIKHIIVSCFQYKS